MNEPVFPQDFIENHCLKVKEFNYWNKVFLGGINPEPIEAKLVAECAFGSAGFGLKCENCNMFIDDKYVYEIKKYYEDMKEYEQTQVLDYSI